MSISISLPAGSIQIETGSRLINALLQDAVRGVDVYLNLLACRHKVGRQQTQRYAALHGMLQKQSGVLDAVRGICFILSAKLATTCGRAAACRTGSLQPASCRSSTFDLLGSCFADRKSGVSNR
jgi:hypothetical protein